MKHCIVSANYGEERAAISVFQLGWEKGRVQKKLGTI